jgi:hypothetical protein
MVPHQDRLAAIDMAASNLDPQPVSCEHLGTMARRNKFLSNTRFACRQAGPARMRSTAESLIWDEEVGSVRPMGRFLRYDLFERRDAILAVPLRCGAVDPRDYDLRFKPGVIATTSPVRARIRVLWAWIRWAYWDGAKI